jgi:tetratricopeptide (TPR) repeat protein
MKAEDFEKVERFLNRFILSLGTVPGSSEVSKLLDRCRIELAKEFSLNGQVFSSFRELALISEKSPSFQEAQDLWDRFWTAYHQKNLRHFTMQGLLVLAEANFKNGHFVKPDRNNAYAIYQAVLSIESRNQAALTGIRQIRKYLLRKANGYFEEKKYREALDYYKRYKLTDSNNAFVNKKIRSCRRHL